MAEVGVDREDFAAWKHFTSWLGLCPSNERSGGKILNRRTRKVVNRATVAFRNAVSTLLKSQSCLGAQYRRLRTRLGAPKAIRAMARKLACLYHRLIKHGQQYVDTGTAYYGERYGEQQIRAVVRKAQKLGLTWLSHNPRNPAREGFWRVPARHAGAPASRRDWIILSDRRRRPPGNR